MHKFKQATFNCIKNLGVNYAGVAQPGLECQSTQRVILIIWRSWVRNPPPVYTFFLKKANTFYSQTLQIFKMSKKILVFAALFSLALSMTITQEANALTRATGDFSRTTASLDPSRVCGNHVCQPGETAKWSSAVMASQRQGPGKATGAQYGNIIMHQIVVNSLVKSSHANQMMWTYNSTMTNSHTKMVPNHANMNMTGSK